MILRKAMRKAGPTPASFAGGFAFDGSGPTDAVDLSGFADGDLVMIFVTVVSGSASITGGAGGWINDSVAWVTYGYRLFCLHKFVVPADLTTVTLNLGSGESPPVQVVGYRGATGAVLKDSSESLTSTLSFDGFTKDESCRRIVTYAATRDPTDLSFLPPGNAQLRNTRRSEGFFCSAVADIFPVSYANLTAINWTNFVVPPGEAGFVYELT